MASCCSLSFVAVSSKPNKPYSSPISSSVQLPILPFSKSSNHSLLQTQCSKIPLPNSPTFLVVGSAKKQEPLRIMISGAPASGKGTQCELITKKYDLVHIAAGDLLRAEIAADTENGRRAKEYMDKGQLVPDEIVVTMVKDRLMHPDSQEKGWLLDGYPRSLSQAVALKEFGVQPDLFILLEVKLRLQTHYQNVESVLSLYQDITVQVDGSVSKEEVFAQIDGALSQLLETK
ncbi:adenylate kinase 2, chloroplastic-like isoform X3 [Lycium ferocissimum]|uniref:adenylate kinase 2, chloroplastic-like isoform X3 n=1 Tax=Lycium ferocissimum TaxID=112874 RepID=UPI002815E1AE|nr:adenylate kinase 2, chloroplastic-like isoform X3 [Lycium ferocissimum]